MRVATSELDKRGLEARSAAALDQFVRVSLAEMEDFALLERRSTKVLLAESSAFELIAALEGDYRVLEVNGKCSHDYLTLYFDTVDFALFYAHHNGRPLRFKVRSRLYSDSAMAFFEVKVKDARDVTTKSRISTACMIAQIGQPETEFIASHAPYVPESLGPVLFTSFSRITLVDPRLGDRLTLDFDIGFSAEEARIALPGLVVAELKHQRAGHDSRFLGLTRHAGIHDASFSKYCVGVSLLHPEHKHNRFRPTLRHAERITGASCAN